MSPSPNVSTAVEDEELDQLVNDIEELREAMNAGPKKKTSRRPMPESEGEASAEPGSVSDFHASGDEPSMEETLGDLKEDEESMPRGRSILDEPVEAEASADEVADSEAMHADEDETAEEPAEEPVEEVYGEAEGEQTMVGSREREMGGGSGEDGSLTMTVRGSMTLKLKYECDGQEVMVGVQGNALVVQLADGTEFRIPVRRGGSSRLKAVG